MTEEKTKEKKEFDGASLPPSTPSVEGERKGPAEERLSFREAMQKAKVQVNFGREFAPWLEIRGEARERLSESSASVARGRKIAVIAEELCKVMAEVYMMSSTSQIRISGEMLDGYMAKSVFAEITADHVRAVAEEYAATRCAVKNPKAYLRTVLYNSVFSLNSKGYSDKAREEGRYGDFNVTEAFEIALRRSYGE